MNRQNVFKCIVVGLLLTGCASIPRSPGFSDVQQTVEKRSGKQVVWYQGQPEDVRVDSAVHTLLQDSLTIEEAVQIALLNNRRLQAVYENLGISQAQVIQAGLLENPVFSGSAVSPLQGSGSPDLTLTLAIDFLDIFFIPLRKSIARSVFEAAKLRVTGSVLDMAGQTSAAYYRMQADVQLLEMQQQVVQSTEASYEAILRLYQAGNVTKLDVGIEQAFYEQARLDLEIAKLNVKQSREQLNRLMGLWSKNVQWIAASRLPAIPDEPLDLDNLEKRAIAASIDLAASRQEIITFGRILGLTKKTALFPMIDLGTEAEREEGGWKLGPEGSLALPLFDQGQARKASARAQLRQQQAQYYALAVEIRSVARTARERLLRARRIALHYQNVVVPLRSDNTRLTQLQFNAMQVGVFQLLQAKRQEVEAGRNYLESLYNYWATRTGVNLLLQGRISGLSEDTSLETGSTESMNSERGH